MSQQIKTNDDLVKKIEKLKLNMSDLSQDERERGWQELLYIAKDDSVMMEKIIMLWSFIDKQIPFLGKVPSWAVQGKDYMIIPNGTVYYNMDENTIKKTQRPDYFLWIKDNHSRYRIYDYEKEGLLPDNISRAEWNGGAGMIFDGEYVLLTCNSRLYEKTKEKVGAKTDGLYNHFYDGRQYACFDSNDMELEFKSVITNAPNDPDAWKSTLYYKFYEMWREGRHDVTPINNYYNAECIAAPEDLLNKLKKYDQANEINQITSSLEQNNKTPISVAPQKDSRQI